MILLHINHKEWMIPSDNMSFGKRHTDIYTYLYSIFGISEADSEPDTTEVTSLGFWSISAIVFVDLWISIKNPFKAAYQLLSRTG